MNGRMMRDPGTGIKRTWARNAAQFGVCGCTTCDAYIDRTTSRTMEKQQWKRDAEARS